MRRHDRTPRFSRHAFLGRDDDRDDPERWTHDPRAGFAPTHGLRDEPDLYARRSPDGLGPVFDSPFDALGAGAAGSRGSRRRPDPQWQTPDEARTSYVTSAGLGPRGDKRSDARVYEDVCEALATDDEVDVRDVEVRVADGEVTLVGVVPEREMKWRIEDIALAVRGVLDVWNQLRVDRREDAHP